MLLVHCHEEAGEHDNDHHKCRKARPRAAFEKKEKRQADYEGYRKANDLPLRQIESDFCFDFGQVFRYRHIGQCENLLSAGRSRLMCVEDRFCKCAGLEQGKAENNGVGCKGENRAVQIVRYYHAVYQNGVNADAYHD